MYGTVCAAIVLCSVNVCAVPHVLYRKYCGLFYNTRPDSMLWHCTKKSWAGRHGLQCRGSKPQSDELGCAKG